MAAEMDTGKERGATDAGRTGDKVSAPDPAAVPVQTDAEATGQPTPFAAAWASTRRLIALARLCPAPNRFGAQPQPREERERTLRRVLLLWAVLLCLLGIGLGIAGLP